jgi:DNA-binding transcriptional LysR family regulator
MWERLDAWELFEEPYLLQVNADHPLARRNEVEAAQLAGEHFLSQTGCEMTEVVTSVLGEHGVSMTSTHEIETDNDLISLLEANAGIALVPASAPCSTRLRRLPVRELRIRRKVFIYAVAGRQRSPVTTTLLNLLRAGEWPELEMPAVV